MQAQTCVGFTRSKAISHTCTRRIPIYRSQSRLGVKVCCKAYSSPDEWSLSRRALLAASTVWTSSSLALHPALAAGGQAAQVGDYLPPAGVENFVEFIPDAKKTPAIRAGTVNPNSPYKFALPPTWRESKVANILSGNYCQPRCDEPWTEVIFEDPQEGRAALLAAPLFKLTPKNVTNISEIGTPEGIITSVGPYVTGTFLDEESVLSSDQKKLEDGQIYYYYEIDSPFAKFGQHIVSSVATKGEVALLFVVSATEKQWAKSEGRIRKMVDTFRI